MRIVSIAVVVLLWVGLVIGLYWYYIHEPVAERPVPEPPADGAPVEAEPEYPVPSPDRGHVASDETVPEDAPQDTEAAQPAPDPLPPLHESDAHILAQLAQVVGQAVLDEWFKDERVVERLVVTIHSLDGESISLRFWPVHHLGGLPSVTRSGDTLRWSAVNSVRYRPVVDLLVSVEPRALAEVYFRNYPLFQQAWAGLGEEPGYFNDRLVEIVDHLLGAPEVQAGFRVKQPKVLYEYADPALEAQSWGRKVLMRMGADNAARVKQWLRRLRAALVAGEPASG